MKWFLVALLATASGCVTTGTATCDDGSICREGTVCHAVSSSGTIECVTNDQLEACAGMEDFAVCDNGAGTCFSEACFPVGCGNGRTDAGEDCDDGNTVIGDGCSLSCKAEVCGNQVVDPIHIDPDTEQIQLLEQCDEGDQIGHDGCSSTCQVEVPRWRDVGGLPRERAVGAIAVDPHARKAVLFGGLDNLTAVPDPNGGASEEVEFFLDGLPLGDTWELTAGGWSQVTSLSTPPPRGAHAMVYDDDAQRVIMFGGTSSRLGNAVFGDTWEYRNGNWTRLEPEIVGGLASDLPRYGHAMVFVPGTGIVMFGGHNRGALGDTWVFSGNTWTLLPTTGDPPPRAYHTLTYDPVRNIVVMTGGIFLGKPFTPMGSWKLEGTTWSPISEIDGPLTFGSSAAFDERLQKVVVTAGKGGAEEGDYTTATWVFDGLSWSIVDTLTAIAPRFGGAGALDPDSGGMIVLGGRAQSCGFGCIDLPLADTYYLAETGGSYTWNARGFVETPALKNHAAAYDIDRRRTVVFGGDPPEGLNGDPSVSNTTYEVVESTWQLVEPIVRPPARVSPAMAYGRLANGQRGTVIFGGASGTVLGDTWRYDGATWTQIMGTQPPARRDATLAFDSSRKRYVLFGGEVGLGTKLDDTWELDETGWRQVTIAGDKPTARSQAAIAYDPVRERIWLWGGVTRVDDGMGNTSAVDLGDLWSFDGTAWTKHDVPNGPAPRRSAKLAYDYARRTLVLYGGGPPANAEVWEWNGMQWTFQSTFELPVGRFDHVLFPHPLGGVIAHGGVSNLNTIASQQLLRREALAPYAACHAEIDDDNDSLIGCADPDCWATCKPWCPPGVTCDDTLPRCGDDTCEPTRESCALCPQDCACP